MYDSYWEPYLTLNKIVCFYSYFKWWRIVYDVFNFVFDKITQTGYQIKASDTHTEQKLNLDTLG